MPITFTSNKLSKYPTTTCYLFIVILFACLSNREVRDDNILLIITKTFIILSSSISIFIPFILTILTVNSIILMSFSILRWILLSFSYLAWKQICSTIRTVLIVSNYWLNR